MPWVGSRSKLNPETIISIQTNLDQRSYSSSKTTTKSSSRRSTQERKSVEFSSSVNSPRRSKTKSPSPFEKSESYKSESERVKTKTPNQESPRSLRISHLSSQKSSVKSSEKSSHKSSKHSSGIKLLEMSPRRMAPPSTTEQSDESTQEKVRSQQDGTKVKQVV